uniref:Uncharacterized protein n=1 Tax=Arundo donax TaxID=35708 RepID=A0A0A9FN73_ARUDO
MRRVTMTLMRIRRNKLLIDTGVASQLFLKMMLVDLCHCVGLHEHAGNTKKQMYDHLP